MTTSNGRGGGQCWWRLSMVAVVMVAVGTLAVTDFADVLRILARFL